MTPLPAYPPPEGGKDFHARRTGGLPLRPEDMAELLRSFRALSDILALDELYAMTARILCQRLALEELAIFVCDETQSYELAHAQGFRDLPRRLRKAGLAAALGPPCDLDQLTRILNAAARISAPAAGPAATGGFRASLWLPLAVRREVLGFLALGARRDGRPFDDHDRGFLEQLVAHAASCLHTCRLYAERQAEKEDLDKTLQNLSLLYDIGKAINFIGDLKKLLQYILGQAIGITSAERGSIMLYDMESDRLQIRVLAHFDGDADNPAQVNNGEVSGRSFRPGEGIAGRVFLTAKPLVVNDIHENASFVGSEATFVRSIACIPMVVYNETIGVINVTNKRSGGGFTPEDVAMLRAVADQAAAAVNKAQLWNMAVTDSLTGLYVRRYFMVKLQEEVHRAERHGKVLSVVMADLDHFKSINDTYGHAAGDWVLKTIGGYLRKNIREVDILARYGGEEFVFLLPEADRDAAFRLAERLRQGLSQLPFGDLPRVTASMGIASYPADALRAEELIELADSALYASKQSGRNLTVCYSPPAAPA